VRPRVASYAIVWAQRAAGFTAVTRCVHDVPSHSQVSSFSAPLVPAPPNSTTTWRAAS
jgi:hypothetical protein